MLWYVYRIWNDLVIFIVYICLPSMLKEEVFFVFFFKLLFSMCFRSYIAYEMTLLFSLCLYYKACWKKKFFLSFFFIFFYIFFYIFFFIFSSFKGVPVVRTTYQEGAGLPNYQEKIPVNYCNWTNGLEVMTYFLT